MYSIASEWGTSKLIAYFARHQRSLLPVLEAVFAQLMLLGLFSCILFASHKAGLMEALVPLLKDSAHVIGEKAEDVHFLLFIGLMIYVVTITVVILISVQLVRGWGRNETRGLADVAARYAALLRQREARGNWAYANPVFLYRLLDLRYVNHYHLLRADFVAQQHLPEHYDFARYLKRCIGHCFSELVEIHWTNWLLLLLIVGINWTRYVLVRVLSASMTISTDMHPEFWGAMGGLFMLGAVILYIKCQLVLNHLAAAAQRRLARQDLLPSGELPALSVNVRRESRSKEGNVQSSVDDGLSAQLPAITESEPLLSYENADEDILLARQNKHKKLFWFNRPNLLFRLIQLLLLFQSWFVALLVIFLPAEQEDWSAAQIVFVFLPPLVTAVTFAPVVLPIFTLIRYVGPYARPDLIKAHEYDETRSVLQGDHDESDDDDDDDNSDAANNAGAESDESATERNRRAARTLAAQDKHKGAHHEHAPGMVALLGSSEHSSDH